MSRREAIETALAAWRDAERRLASAVDGERETFARQVERHRADFQQLSADHMVERIGSRREADASDIWEAARTRPGRMGRTHGPEDAAARQAPIAS